MRCIERGPVEDRRPETVVGGLHGDEPCDVHAIEDLPEPAPIFHRRVRFVVANECVLAAGERFVDHDINRAFPGDASSDPHEPQLAGDLMERNGGAEVVAIHSTDVEPTTFALFYNLERDDGRDSPRDRARARRESIRGRRYLRRSPRVPRLDDLWTADRDELLAVPYVGPENVDAII